MGGCWPGRPLVWARAGLDTMGPGFLRPIPPLVCAPAGRTACRVWTPTAGPDARRQGARRQGARRPA
ncbi:unnamed protein product [[Actinomadura] parvosata subsp. kistnae]|nr:unnamed protein product [Actinomadura parvosata subsp. kistnae]